MKYVIDSSVSFKWAVPESDSAKADRFRDTFRNAVRELVAPDVFSLGENRVKSVSGKSGENRKIGVGKSVSQLFSLKNDVIPIFSSEQKSTSEQPQKRYACLFVCIKRLLTRKPG